MNRGKWTWRDGEFVPVGKEKHIVAAPSIIQDSMDATWHPCDGKKYESKSVFRRITRAHNCVEVGEERPFVEARGLTNQSEERKEAIRDAIEQLSSVERRKEILDHIRWQQAQIDKDI